MIFSEHLCFVQIIQNFSGQLRDYYTVRSEIRCALIKHVQLKEP
jgi:hypothetical protein